MEATNTERVQPQILLNRLRPLIGNTRMVELEGFASRKGAHVYAKLEWDNLTDSLKARPALRMISDRLEDGELVPGKTIIDATSGNTGHAVALIGALLGYPVKLVIPERASERKQEDIRRWGANLIVVPGDNTERARDTVAEMVARDPAAFCWLDQYSSESNWRAHFDATGPEIVAQCPHVTHMVVAQGSAGTGLGCIRFFNDAFGQQRRICVYAVVAAPGQFTRFEGIKDADSADRQPLAGEDFLRLLSGRKLVTGADAKHAIEVVRRRYGLLPGPSAGAVLFAAYQVAQKAELPAHVVCILADGADKYPHHPFYDADARMTGDELNAKAYASW